MPVKAVSPRRKIEVLAQQLEQVKLRRLELYKEYNQAKSEKSRDKIRSKVRPLDLLLETYFYQLWKAYKKLPDELEEIDRYKGFDKKTRVVYCDGEFHLVIGKTGKYRYGYFCNCD